MEKSCWKLLTISTPDMMPKVPFQARNIVYVVVTNQLKSIILFALNIAIVSTFRCIVIFIVVE